MTHKFPVQLAAINTITLYDTEANITCMSYACYIEIKDPPPLQNKHALSMHSAMVITYVPWCY